MTLFSVWKFAPIFYTGLLTGSWPDCNPATTKSKGRSEVALTPSNLSKQKGSGNARQGSRKGAQFRKGGIVFGPVVRDHSHELTKKFRKLGLKISPFSKS